MYQDEYDSYHNILANATNFDAIVDKANPQNLLEQLVPNQAMALFDNHISGPFEGKEIPCSYISPGNTDLLFELFFALSKVDYHDDFFLLTHKSEVVSRMFTRTLDHSVSADLTEEMR